MTGGGITADSRPLYVRIAQKIRQGVRDGTYVPGEILPGERLLASSMGISPETARRAVRMVCEEGGLILKRGIGYEVQEAPPKVRVPIRVGDRVSFEVAAHDDHIPDGAPVIIVQRAAGVMERYDGNDTELEGTLGR